MIDVDKERTRLSAELETVEEQIQRLTILLGSEFAKKAPEDIVNRERDKLALLQTSQTELQKRLTDLN